MIKEGILNINKPSGMTSHDCIYAVRRLTGIKRVGHTGTLDPNATGVLPVCVGRCSRISEYTELDLKTYECTMQLGIVTDTQDIWGNVISDKRRELYDGAYNIDERSVHDVFSRFSGNIEQYPPRYSAVRYAGKRLYEYARDGQEIEIRPRKVYIDNIDIKNTDLSGYTVTFSVTCGKGTYIRAICNDAGEMLGCGASMSSLVRTASGAFRIEDSVPLEYLKELTASGDRERIEKEVNDMMYAPDYPLTSFGRAVIKTYDRSRWFINGGHIRMSETDILKEPVYRYDDAPFEIRQEYREAYSMYGYMDEISERKGESVFLGVAFYNHDYKKLVADKVFRRTDEDF